MHGWSCIINSGSHTNLGAAVEYWLRCWTFNPATRVQVRVGTIILRAIILRGSIMALAFSEPHSSDWAVFSDMWRGFISGHSSNPVEEIGIFKINDGDDDYYWTNTYACRNHSWLFAIEQMPLIQTGSDSNWEPSPIRIFHTCSIHSLSKSKYYEMSRTNQVMLDNAADEKSDVCSDDAILHVSASLVQGYKIHVQIHEELFVNHGCYDEVLRIELVWISWA